MTHAEKVREIRARSPFPWHDEVHPRGTVRILDSLNNEVALFDIVALSVITTLTMAAQQFKEKA